MNSSLAAPRTSWCLNWSRRNLAVAAAFALLVLAAYARVINGPLLFDDEHYIQKNEYVISFDVAKIYTTSVTQGAGMTSNFYRPNQQLVYALLYQLFGDAPAPYHLTSLAVHLANAFLVFLLLLQLGFPRRPAFLAGLIYLLHPVNTEAVAYISGLADPLGLFFVLLGLRFYLKFATAPVGRGALGAWGWSVLLFTAALFFKENCVVFFPLVVLVTIYLRLTRRITQSTRLLFLANGAFLLLAGGYLLLKFTIFNFTPHAGLTGQENIYTQNLMVRLVTFINVLPEYFRLLLFPVDLYYEKPYVAFTSLAGAGGLGGLLAILVFLFLAGMLAAKKLWATRPFLALGWFLAALLPYTGVVPLNAMYLEHWLYVPLIGFCLGLAALAALGDRTRFRALYLALFLAAAGLCLAKTFDRSAEWGDVERFYLNELRHTSHSARIWNNLGMYYADHGQNEKALDYYKQALQAGDRYPQTHHNLALIYWNMGRLSDAFAEFHAALKLDPRFIYTLHQLHNIYLKTNHLDKAARIEKLMSEQQQDDESRLREIDQIISSD